MLAETTEIFGAEHLLVRRARNREVGEKLLTTPNPEREEDAGLFRDLGLRALRHGQAAS